MSVYPDVSIYTFFMWIAIVLVAGNTFHRLEEGGKDLARMGRRWTKLLSRFFLPPSVRLRLLEIIYGSRMWSDVDEFVERFQSEEKANLELMWRQMMAKYPLAKKVILNRVFLVLGLGELSDAAAPYSFPKRE